MSRSALKSLATLRVGGFSMSTKRRKSRSLASEPPMESSTLNAAVNITVLPAPSMRSAYHFSIFESLRGEKMHVIDFFLVSPAGVGVMVMHDTFASLGSGFFASAFQNSL